MKQERIVFLKASKLCSDFQASQLFCKKWISECFWRANCQC